MEREIKRPICPFCYKEMCVECIDYYDRKENTQKNKATDLFFWECRRCYREKRNEHKKDLRRIWNTDR